MKLSKSTTNTSKFNLSGFQKPSHIVKVASCHQLFYCPCCHHLMSRPRNIVTSDVFYNGSPIFHILHEPNLPAILKIWQETNSWQGTKMWSNVYTYSRIIHLCILQLRICIRFHFSDNVVEGQKMSNTLWKCMAGEVIYIYIYIHMQLRILLIFHSIDIVD